MVPQSMRSVEQLKYSHKAPKRNNTMNKPKSHKHYYSNELSIYGREIEQIEENDCY